MTGRGRRVPDRRARRPFAHAAGRVPADARPTRCCAARGRCGCAFRRASRSRRGGRGARRVPDVRPAASAARCRRAARSSSCRASRTGAGASSGRSAASSTAVRDDLPVQGRVRGPALPACACGCGPTRAIRTRSATRGWSASACDERRATCRRWTHWPRRSRRRARWPSRRRGRCWRSGARSCSRGADDEVDLGARARAWAAAAERPSLRRVLERDRRDRAHEPRARAAGGGGARGGRGGRGRLLEPRAGPGDGRARVAARARRGAAVRADRARRRRSRSTTARARRCSRRPRWPGPGREVVVSRGQLVEIGGGFRVPDVIAQAGARLVEVGTTNRTRLADYQRALGPGHGRRPAGAPVELPPARVRRGRRRSRRCASSASR